MEEVDVTPVTQIHQQKTSACRKEGSHEGIEPTPVTMFVGTCAGRKGPMTAVKVDNDGRYKSWHTELAVM